MGNGHLNFKGHYKVYFQSLDFILTLLTPYPSPSQTYTMDSREAFDEWIASAEHVIDADLIYPRFCTSVPIEESLSLVDPTNPILASFRSTCDPITFGIDGSPHRWVPKHFLYAMKRTDAHKRAVDRAISGVASHLRTVSDVERDVAFAIFIIYTPYDEAAIDDDEPPPSIFYPAFLDEEPVETPLDLQEEEQEALAFIDPQPVAMEKPLVTPVAALTPLIIEGVEYLLLQDVLEVLDLSAEELYCQLVRDAGDDFIDFEVEDQPPHINEVGRYDGSCVDTLTAVVEVQASIASAANAPEYSLSDAEFEKLQEEMFGPRLPSSEAPPEDNVETMPVPGCDLDAASLAEQDYVEQVLFGHSFASCRFPLFLHA